ncbi:MAG: metallophosphoesterase family protein [Victivallales bacterium]|nr:metallophosphoesterase family protein [Victivallales bacterium]
MKILFITDLHGQFDALAKLPSADLLLVGGDLTNFGIPEEFRMGMQKIEAVFPDFKGVAGNLDPGMAADEILAEGSHLLSLQEIECKGIRLLGLSGSNLCPRPTPYQWDDEYMIQQFVNKEDIRIDILVTHAPPHGFGADVIPNGMHVGSHAVKRLAEMTRPRLHLCGHIHEASGVFDENDTLLVNPGPFGKVGNYALIELPDGQKPVVTLGKAIQE